MSIKFKNWCWRHLSGIAVCLTAEKSIMDLLQEKKYMFILEEKHKGAQYIKLGG